jgi:3-deoxy-7-phosphoheptulonate synthase
MLKTDEINNRNITSFVELPSPQELKSELATNEQQFNSIKMFRDEIRNVIHGRDPRLLIVVGPCSIHDEAAAFEFAQKLKKVSVDVASNCLLVMRTYFEKPRTIAGWKGFINDPDLDGTFKIAEGLRRARKLMLDITSIDLPIACEMVDLISPQFLADLVSWTCIGARTTESQSHRELASGLSMPVGFKNGTLGDVQIAINAAQSAAHPHSFLSVDDDGKVSMFGTSGNPDCHIVLRGGSRPNYDSESVWQAEQSLKEASLFPFLMVDCNHGNSRKDFRRQPTVFRDCLHQVRGGNRSIRAIMLESNLIEGAQKLKAPLSSLAYGVSVTDSCLGFDQTSELIYEASECFAKHNSK